MKINELKDKKALTHAIEKYNQDTSVILSQEDYKAGFDECMKLGLPVLFSSWAWSIERTQSQGVYIMDHKYYTTVELFAYWIQNVYLPL